MLYLNPIVEACSNHRYDTADYRRPDPILGSMEDFRELTRQAAKLGIRVILDGVYSHTGADSIYFNRYGHYDSQGACQSKDSPYYGWYDFSEYPDKYRSWWGFDSLPEVEEENPAWQEFVITGQDSVIRTWLREGASGWRLDVADELPDDVLELIRTAVKEESPDHVLLGEVWEDAIEKESYGTRRTYALGRALDTVMNYPLRNAVLAFLSGEGTAEELKLDTTSGRCQAELDERVREIELDSVSGELELILPESLGFEAEVDTVSGSFRSDIPTTASSKGVYTCGNGECGISVDTVSGSISIQKK